MCVSGFILCEPSFIHIWHCLRLPDVALLLHIHPFYGLHGLYSSFIAPPQRSKLNTPLEVDWIVLLCCNNVLTVPLPPQSRLFSSLEYRREKIQSRTRRGYCSWDWRWSWKRVWLRGRRCFSIDAAAKMGMDGSWFSWRSFWSIKIMLWRELYIATFDVSR